MATNHVCSHLSAWKGLIMHKVLGRDFKGYYLEGEGKLALDLS